MALVRQQHTVPDQILSPELKTFLESLDIGRWAIHKGRNLRKVLRDLLDPQLRQVWLRRLALPVRNALLLNRPFSFSFNGFPVLLGTSGRVAADIWTGTLREECRVLFLLRLLKPGMVFFDVGADSGLYAIAAAKKIGAGTVFTFPSSRAARQVLTADLRLNGLDGVTVIEEPQGYLDEGRSRGFDTLAQFLESHPAWRVDVLRLGAVGAEMSALVAVRRLLESPDAPLVVYRTADPSHGGLSCHPVEILWFLEMLGYVLFQLNEKDGTVSEIKPEFAYDSPVVAIKPGQRAFPIFHEQARIALGSASPRPV